MLDGLIRFVLSQRVLVLIVTGILIAAGIVAWQRLPVDAFPDVTNVQVMVLTEAPGLSPVDVEQQITFPIELAMQGLPDVRQVRSLSKSALSQVVVVFEDHVDIYFARQLVFEKLESAKKELPEWAAPEMGPISTGLGEIYQYTLESDSRSLMELRTIQDWLVAPQLRLLPGITEVNSFGGYVKQYQILVDPDRLLQYGITLREVVEAVEANNANAGGNYIVKGWEQAYVRSVGLIRSLEDIENIVLESRDGTPIFVRDVARVTLGGETRQGAVTRDGRGETVAGMAIMLKGANSKEVVDRVKEAVARIQAGLPEDVRISPFYDRTALIQACIRTVRSALLQGGILVVLVLFLFLGNLRAALVVALSLPLTAFFAFILMGVTGVTANLMSLGGLAIAIGMIVDASIIVSENIARHLSERSGRGQSRVRITIDATSEVARPILFAILIIVIVLIPLFTLEQMEGKMFRPLALTMCFATFGSLVIALTVVPVLSSWILRGHTGTRENWLVRGLRRGYEPLLAAALRRRRATIGISAGLFLVALALVPFLGTEFLPSLDEGAIAVNVVRLPSASLDGSVAVGAFIEQRLARFPEVQTIVTKTGRAEISEDPMGPEQSDIVIMLHPQDRWATGRRRSELVDAIEADLTRIPGLRFAFSQPIALRVNELISGIKSDLAIKIFGPDLDLLAEHAERVAGVLNQVDGAHDVTVEQISGFSQIEVGIDRGAIARYKINVEDINEIIETAVGGKIATTVVEEQKRFAVLVRYPESARGDIESLRRTLVRSPEGARIPLGQLAWIEEVEAPAQITRENNHRRIAVECNIRGRDIGGFVDEVSERLRPVIADLPEGYFVEFGGQFENQQRSMRRLSIVVPISIALIFLMLFSAFGSLRSALLVLSNLPFALVGGVLTILILKINLSVPAAIGFIAVFGIAVEDGTVMVSFFNRFRREGLNPLEAVERGCRLRFPSVLMTTLTTLLGLAPMFFATGSGSEIQRPLAAVVLGGLASALVLTLLVLPALYSVVEERTPTRGTTE